MRLSSINYSVNFGSRRNYANQNAISNTKKPRGSGNVKDSVDYFSRGYGRLGTLDGYGSRPIDAFNETMDEAPCEFDELLDSREARALGIDQLTPGERIAGVYGDLY